MIVIKNIQNQADIIMDQPSFNPGLIISEMPVFTLSVNIFLKKKKKNVVCV